MIGSIRWNVWVSAVVALTAFLLSLRVNPPFTSFIRSGIAFIILFSAVFLVRAVISMVSTSESNENSKGNLDNKEASAERETKAQYNNGTNKEEEVEAEEASKMIRELMNNEE